MRSRQKGGFQGTARERGMEETHWLGFDHIQCFLRTTRTVHGAVLRWHGSVGWMVSELLDNHTLKRNYDGKKRISI